MLRRNDGFCAETATCLIQANSQLIPNKNLNAQWDKTECNAGGLWKTNHYQTEISAIDFVSYYNLVGLS